MAKVVTDDSHYKAIADTIREQMANAGMNETMHPAEMAGWISDACTVARAAGKTEGVAEGKQTEYDRFWDAYQENGNRTNYEHSFRGTGWTQETFRPKYNLILSGSNISVFQNMGFVGDLAQRLEDLGVTLDTSRATVLSSLFNSATDITRIGVIDISNAPNSNAVFAYFKGHTIDKVIVTENNMWDFQFQTCTYLENLTIEGAIGKSGLNLQWSTKLSKASITSVVNALSRTTSGLSVTFSETAVNNAFTEAEWAVLAAAKPNWTINLV
ncbi:MAG: hypothetical protein IKK17_08125 [Oscillospiraceae bacterium]|nr:hypothetical protein [Oscillospiraceae bacterium]